MVEKDLRIVQKEFRDIVGFTATAKISEESALRSAEVIVELEVKVCENKTQPTDLLRAVLATSQLVEHWSQLQQRFELGLIPTVGNVKKFNSVHEKITEGNLPMEENMNLFKVAYVAKPSMGANKAMELLSKLRTIYKDIPIQQPHV